MTDTAKEPEGNVGNVAEKKKRKTLEEKIEAAEARAQQLRAKKQKLEARERAKKTKLERAKDTRRKILVGALVLSKVEKGEWTPAQLQDLTKDLTRDDDRALFGLSPPNTQQK